MTISHSLEGASGDATAPKVRPSSSTRPSERPVNLGPKPPAWNRSTRAIVRAQTAVHATLFIAVAVMLVFVATRRQPGKMRAWVEAERPMIELRLSLAELRAIITDYHVEHGAFPGCDANGAAVPRWFERQWERAIERSNSAPGNARLTASGAPGGVPHNPVNGLATVRFLASNDPWPVAADDATGWVYRPSTGEIRANCTGNAFGSGPAYWDL
ncbi:MAG: hypothetical protein JNL28_06410 [Planctomycetes bacterium]|nr:hypothetical protein [Planctomycetota bacterium]